MPLARGLATEMIESVLVNALDTVDQEIPSVPLSLILRSRAETWLEKRARASDSTHVRANMLEWSEGYLMQKNEQEFLDVERGKPSTFDALLGLALGRPLDPQHVVQANQTPELNDRVLNWVSGALSAYQAGKSA